MTFQQRVQEWMLACFGQSVSADKLERADRFLEEVLELLQSVEYPRERIGALEDYVYSRPVGENHQELGGVMLTLAAFCEPHGLFMQAAGEDELLRVWGKVEKIRKKQARKPHGSALPVATADPHNGYDMDRPRYSARRMKHELDRVKEQARRDLMDELSGTCVVSPENKFSVGDQVEKFTGDYRARGEVRGIFVMKKGALRYVVEHEVADGGGSFCHIYSEGQLRLLEREASDAG